MATASDKKRWDDLHATSDKAHEAKLQYEIELARTYGSQFQWVWLKAGQQKKLDALNERTRKIDDKIIELAVKISPRGDRWQSGVPAWWVSRELTWEDATRPADEPLSVVVPGSYGYPDGTVREASRPATDPTLYTVRPAFGVAGGPDEVILTDEGLSRAFSVGARVKRGAPADALLALAASGGYGYLSLRDGARLRRTELGRFDQIAWGRLRELGYIESFQDDDGDGVQLTAVGEAAVQNGYEERERLLDRCRRDVGGINEKLEEQNIMATRKKAARRSAPKGRGGSSGGGNPQNDGRITEEQHEDAMRTLRAEYYQAVRGLAEEVARNVEAGMEEGDALHQVVDGSYWVIYTHANFQVLMCSEHHDAYSEDFGVPRVGDSIDWAVLAFAALSRDVSEQMQSGGVEEAPRGRMRSAGAMRRRVG